MQIVVIGGVGLIGGNVVFSRRLKIHAMPSQMRTPAMSACSCTTTRLCRAPTRALAR
ncbi:hypothetical protein LMG27177_06635 [Paraburkholderia fynbosensis]|uniref:Uncharacterized protein n=1 Tax=Paraburkholderia fynbosensis TaxID=1200993 RepID=A0A6J5GXE3_9BURK|nr:hypothetical protein LMG27177_06635 [Paraburkholderia fynbosensis]